MTKGQKLALGAVGFVVLIGLCGRSVDRPQAYVDATRKTEPTAASTPARKQHFGQRFKTREGAPACLSVDLYKEFVGYWVDKDEGALQQLVASDQCVLLKGGLTVVAEDAVGPLWQYARVRVVGDRQRLVLNPKIALEGWE